jgi:hypothetical protein
MRLKRFVPAAMLVAAFLPAAPAAAAPDRTAPDFTADATSFSWTGKIGVGFAELSQIDDKYPCGQPGHDCDTTLMHVTAPGTLTAVSSTADKQSVDVDLYLYESDSSGTQGELIGSSTGGSADEAVSFDSLGGEWVLVKANYALVVGGSYTGQANFTPST